MDESKRTKILAVVLGLVLVFGVVRPDRRLLDPIRQAKSARTSAETERESAEVQHMQLLVAREQIERSQNASLPHSISDAQRLYQIWVTNLAEQCRFAQLQVAPGRTEYRRGQYLTVNVDVTAETDLDGLSRFLYLFDKVDLMHRVVALDIRSTGAQNNPRMEVTLSAQGLSVQDSPNRAEIFPRTRLASAAAADATEVTVTDTTDFPEKLPFLVQVGREMVNVTAMSDNTLTVKRGVEGTSPTDHPAQISLQLFPIAFAQRDRAYDDYKTLLAASPFTKPARPRTYNPRLASITDRKISPGESVQMTARAEDLDLDVGAPVFRLEGAPDGMTIDEESGELSWTPSEDVEPKGYSGIVVMTQKNNDELRIEKSFTITIEIPNKEPQLKVDDRAVVIIGRSFSLQATAEDDGPENQLKYALEGTVPEGLSVDASSGQLKWTPAASFKPAEYQVTVKVSDSGTPEKSDTAQLTLQVVDDHASRTKFTGSVALDGVPQAYFRNLGTNERPIFSVGDRVSVSEIDAELTEITGRHVLLADAAGVWKLDLGENLRERELIEPAADDTEQPQSETPPDEQTTANADSESSEEATDETSGNETPDAGEAEAAEPAAEAEA